MRKLKTMCLLMSLLMCSNVTLNTNSVLAEEVSTEDTVENTLKQANIDYTQSTETISNPGMGYTQTIWYTCKPNDTPVKNPTGSLVLMFVDIGAFSSGSNGTTDDQGNYTEGTDYDLDQSFFDGLRQTFENARNNGCTIALRFRYDANGKTNPEPATFDKVLQHIQQIKDSNILEDYKDILMFVESGFVGAWGEQHSGKYTSLEYKAQLLDAMLDLVPDDIPVTVRTPNTFAKWVGIEMSELGDYVSTGNQLRVGMYNDGYMGSDSDLGTFTYNREQETSWLSRQTITSYYGGEFSGNLDWAKKYDTYLPQNAIPEMYKTHLSYINANVYQLYKDYTFGAEYDVDNVDNSSYYGETVFKFIRDHIGYRFVLKNSELNESVSQGGTLNLNFDIENTGFANPIRSQKAEVILEKDGNYITTQVDLDTTKWYSCTTTNSKITLNVPNIEAGTWNVYLKLSVGDNTVPQHYLRSVKFANNDIWNTSLGANYLGSVDVTATTDQTSLTNNTFYQTNTDNPYISNADMLTIKDIKILDGLLSNSSEWSESSKIAEDVEKDNQLYLYNDDKYLYIMGHTVQDAEKPVYNIRLTNSTNGETYWLYYQTNGFTYFNHGDYTGCVYKNVGDYVEFKIPFEVMGLEDGSEISYTRLFIQDEANSWGVTANLETNDTYTVVSSFNSYSAYKEIYLNQGENYTLNVETSLDNATYQWYLNDTPIDGATEKTYTITDANSNSIGKYSVKVTSENNVSKDIDICSVLDVFSNSEELLGDINLDGVVDSVDILLLKKHILSIDTQSIDVSKADLNGDNSINVLDLIKLKNIILS